MWMTNFQHKLIDKRWIYTRLTKAKLVIFLLLDGKSEPDMNFEVSICSCIFFFSLLYVMDSQGHLNQEKFANDYYLLK